MAGLRSGVALGLLCAAFVLPQNVAADGFSWPSWASSAFGSQTIDPTQAAQAAQTTISSSSSDGSTTTTTTTSGNLPSQLSQGDFPTTTTTTNLPAQFSRGNLNTQTQPQAIPTPTTGTPATQTPTTPSTPATQNPTPTTTSPTPAVPTTPSSAGAYGDYLAPHNAARAQYGASPLTVSSELVSYAQGVVNKCVFAHSHGPYGENLYEASGDLATWQQGVNAWMSEASKYNAASPDYTQSGHFTQVVWKSSTQVGCAAANCNGMVIFACEYNPPGNYEGEYSQNVQA